ncbi:MAG: COX15/CtaA family protein [Gammaproteobacteria bacterium]|jgi:heme a synthase|nr:COX15/CtaA family protein [Gammaproteobacteria bacterium]
MTKINYYLLFVITVTFAVITLGAYVRLSHAGLGCPDWPGCYGYLIGVPDNSIEIANAENSFQGSNVDIGKAWKEMIHRYIAGALGIFIFILPFIFYKNNTNKLFKLSLLVSILVVMQAMLGMLTVTLQLQPLIVMMHLMGGLTIITLLWLIFLRYNKNNYFNESQSFPNLSLKRIKNLSVLGYITLIVLVIQIMLGGWTSTNYAALACADFPKCNASWWPQMDFYNAFMIELATDLNYEFGRLDSPARVAIHFTHRIWAIVAAAMLVILSIASYKTIKISYQKIISLCLVLFLFIQVTLGILNIKMGLPIYVAVAHNGNAAILLMCLVTQLYLIRNVKNNL